MKYRLYELIFPKPVRDRIYLANIRRYELAEKIRRNSIEETARQVELSAVYVDNLRIVINRDAFFTHMPKGAVAAQIGKGQDDILDRIMLITRPKRLHLVDTWEEEEGALDVLRRQYKQEMASERLIINHGIVADEIKTFHDDCLDWVYINSDGTYETTSEILEICREKVREGGIIGGYNYSRGSWIDGVRYGVIEAVHKFCKKQGWEMIYLTHESCRHLSYAVRRIKSNRYGAADLSGGG